MQHLGLRLNAGAWGRGSEQQGAGLRVVGVSRGRGVELRVRKAGSQPARSGRGTHVIGRPPGLEPQVPLQQRRLEPQEFLRYDRRPVEVFVGEDGPDGFQVLRGKEQKVGGAAAAPGRLPPHAEGAGGPTLRTVSCTEGTGWRGRERW